MNKLGVWTLCAVLAVGPILPACGASIEDINALTTQATANAIADVGGAEVWETLPSTERNEKIVKAMELLVIASAQSSGGILQLLMTIVPGWLGLNAGVSLLTKGGRQDFDAIMSKDVGAVGTGTAIARFLAGVRSADTE